VKPRQFSGAEPKIDQNCSAFQVKNPSEHVRQKNESYKMILETVVEKLKKDDFGMNSDLSAS